MMRLLSVAALLGFAAVVSAEEPKKATPSPEAMMKIMAQAATPGPEHKKLEPLVGSWNYTCKFWMEPGKPAMESKGTIERKWILGGRFIEETVKGTNFDGKPGFEGRGMIGYDNAQKKYTMSWSCTMGTGTCSGSGAGDSTGKVFTFEKEAFCPMEKQVVKGKDVVRIESADKIVMESYMLKDGKEMKMMEIVATRKK